MPPLVTGREVADLLALLADGSQSFAQLGARFSAAWPARACDRLRAAFAVLLLLQEGALRQPVQRFAALQLLHSLTRGQPLGRNPFTPFLVQAAQHPARPEAERLFVRLLLAEQPLPQGSIADAVAAAPQAAAAAQLPPAEDLWRVLQEREAERAKQAEAEPGRVVDSRNGGLPPPFVRPKPPRLPLQPGELRWLHPALPQTVHWDGGPGRDPAALQALQQLLSAARCGPLLPAQQQQVLGELEADGRVALLLDVTPASLPDLVEHNPAIAIEVLLRLLQLGRGARLLPALTGMQVSLHSMEVVNRLSAVAQLPPDFLHAYIASCTRSCQAAQEDKYVQTRRVRLVCVFLQSLIRARALNVQELFYEVQAFCIEFSRIREAAALFRLLKSLENGDRPPDAAAAAAAEKAPSSASALPR